MLWQVKAVSVLVNIILIVFIISSIPKGKLRLGKRSKSIVFLVLMMMILVFVSFLRKADISSFSVFFKITGSLLIFYYGLLYRSDIFLVLNRLSRISVWGMLLFLVLSFFAFSYQYWGDSFTFKGLYYFKTDMALAIVVFISFMLLNEKLSIFLKILLFLIGLYLIFLTNARVHILTGILVFVIYFFRRQLFVNLSRKLIVAMPLFLGVTLLSLIAYNQLVDSREGNNLKVELTSDDFFSESNSQGRSVIWATLLMDYAESNVAEKLLGKNLTEDYVIVNRWTGRDYGAHSTFFYLLIATGLVGVLLFVGIMVMFFRCIIFLTKLQEINGDQLLAKEKILFVTFSHLLIFLISSLTNTSIVFQQQTWFFMFFAGYCYNIRLKELIRHGSD